jgi:serine/threonine protein kinase
MKECPRCLNCFEDSVEACPHDGAALVSVFEGDPVIDGKYRVEKRLGHGGMGVVYRVRHVSLQRQFALKLISTTHQRSKSFLAHFQTEARALGRLKHPNIVDVTDYGVDPRAGGLPYLVMEFLEGKPLSEVCREEGALKPERALPIFEGVARAIDYAHEQGVLHRDLKPANVLIVCGEKGTETTKILDFGLARLLAGGEDGAEEKSEAKLGEAKKEAMPVTAEKVLEAAGTGNTTIMLTDGVTLTLPPGAIPSKEPSREFIEGTLAYMAPEVLRGEAPAPSTDIYAFGVLVYETLVGKPPFSGSSLQLLWSHLNTPPQVPSQVQPALPAELDPAILAPVSKDPAKRPRRARDFVATLRKAWFAAQRRKWRAREIPRRLGMAAVLGVVCALVSWPLARLAFVESLEQRATDARFAAHALRSPNPRLLILSVDEPSLAADATPLAERADQFGSILERVFGAGARGVGIDFILPEQWARSKTFSRFLLTRGENVTLAVIPSQSGEMIGTQCVSPLTGAALGPARFAQLFGFANLFEDADGVTRHGRLYFRDANGKQWDSWSTHVARSLKRASSSTGQTRDPDQTFWIDYSVDWHRLPKISWKDVPQQLDQDASVFRGRLVLVGGDLIGSGDDYHRIPALNDAFEAVSGLALQSMLVDTILAGFPVRAASPWLVLLSVAVGCAAVLGTGLCVSRMYTAFVAALAFFALYGGVAMLAFRLRELLFPVASPLLTAVVALGVGLVLRFYLTPFPVVRVEEA